MKMFKYIIFLFSSLIFFALFGASLHAAQVTMASYDFDGDYVDEIIRTDERNGATIIRIYKRIPDSFFCKPFQQFEVSGRLVQVPEIVDVNHDGMKDYFFATGSDMGILYYDILSDTFLRTNDFNFDNAQVDDTSVSDSGEQFFNDEVLLQQQTESVPTKSPSDRRGENSTTSSPVVSDGSIL